MAIVEASLKYVEEWFKKVDLTVLAYHNWKHTVNVYNAATLIAENTEGISEKQLEHLKLAAIFHDSGYVESPDDHEKRSADIASKFLGKKNYPANDIQEVKRLILATKLGHEPKDDAEKIIIDSDLSHLGRADYIDTTYRFLLRELGCSGNMSEGDWAESCESFLSEHKFHTAFAKKRFEENKARNLGKVKELVNKKNENSMDEKDEKQVDIVSKGDEKKSAVTESKENGEKKEKKKKKKKTKPHKEGQSNPLKGVETMFKTALRNHVDLSAIADKKANTLISVNAIIISIVLSALFPKLDSNPFLFSPSVTILIGCFITIILAILSTIPNVTRGEVNKQEVMEKKGNLLFFGNFHKMELKDYEWSMVQLMESKDYIYSSMTRDLFFLGKVLNKKYMLLRYAYYIFMFSLFASIIVFVVNVTPYIGSTADLDIDTTGIFP